MGGVGLGRGLGRVCRGRTWISMNLPCPFGFLSGWYLNGRNRDPKTL